MTNYKENNMTKKEMWNKIDIFDLIILDCFGNQLKKIICLVKSIKQRVAYLSLTKLLNLEGGL